MASRVPTQRRAEETRERLLGAVLEILAERGMAGVSHRAVAERAGVSLSATSYYFESGAELERTAIDVHYAARIADYRATVVSLTDARATPAEMADAAADLLTSSSVDLLLAHFEVYVNAARRPALREVLVPVFASMRGLIEAMADAIGIVDVVGFAMAAIAVIEGVELRRVAEGIGGRDEMAGALRLLMLGALSRQADPAAADRLLETGRSSISGG